MVPMTHGRKRWGPGWFGDVPVGAVWASGGADELVFLGAPQTSIFPGAMATPHPCPSTGAAATEHKAHPDHADATGDVPFVFAHHDRCRAALAGLLSFCHTTGIRSEFDNRRRPGIGSATSLPRSGGAVGRREPVGTGDGFTRTPAACQYERNAAAAPLHASAPAGVTSPQGIALRRRRSSPLLLRSSLAGPSAPGRRDSGVVVCRPGASRSGRHHAVPSGAS